MLAKLHNIAVLIDADNASAKNIGYILQKVESFGRITCKNIYGDWGNAHIKSWQEAMLKHAITPMQQFAYAKGKNATDIGMVIEAMDLLYSNNYDGFCLISSDSDFTALALRIRKNGIKVFGFGKHSTVNAFTQACDAFYYVENLLPLASEQIEFTVTNIESNTKVIPRTVSTVSTKAVDTSRTIKPTTNNKTLQPNAKRASSVTTSLDDEAAFKPWNKERLRCDTKLLNSLRASIVDNPKAKSERWVNFGLVGHGLKHHYPKFKSQYYGYDKLIDIVNVIDLFETKIEKTTLYIREKNNKKIPLSEILSSVGSALKPTATVVSNTERAIPRKVTSDKLPTNKPVTLSSRRDNKNAKQLPDAQTSVAIYSSSSTNVILFCMNTQHKNHSVEDAIYPNQKDSKDRTISLRQNRSHGITKSTFVCFLNKQSKNTDQLVFVVTSKLNDISSDKTCPIIDVDINSWGKSISFSEKFNLHGKSGKNLLLFSLNKVDSEWEFTPQNTMINNDLQNLCRENGIDLSDE